MGTKYRPDLLLGDVVADVTPFPLVRHAPYSPLTPFVEKARAQRRYYQDFARKVKMALGGTIWETRRAGSIGRGARGVDERLPFFRVGDGGRQADQDE